MFLNEVGSVTKQLGIIEAIQTESPFFRLDIKTNLGTSIHYFINGQQMLEYGLKVGWKLVIANQPVDELEELANFPASDTDDQNVIYILWKQARRKVGFYF